jgi:hypothetical protein
MSASDKESNPQPQQPAAAAAAASVSASTSGAPLTADNKPPAAEVCAPLVQALAKYVAAESAAIDGEWLHFAETHQILLDAVKHLKDKSAQVVGGIGESSAAVDEFLQQLNAKSEEVECTLSVLESVAAGLDEYSKVLVQAFPPA